ncbi:MAG: ATP-binding cassette domain-containing protein [Heyndrickxia sp.]
MELKVNGLKKYMEATLVLKNITFEVYEGDKVGIVGANGSGKSTILKLIAELIPMNYYPGYPQTSTYGYDEGLIHRPNGATIAYLELTPVYPEGLKVRDVLNLAFEEVDEVEKKMRDLEEQMKILEDAALEKTLKKYSDLVQIYEVKGGYEREEKFNKVFTGLKFSISFLNKDFDLLSGGEKTTVMLGKLLIHDPDILLLDEPTNHLDIDSIETLELALEEFKGTIFFISHDRYFINKISERVIALEGFAFKSYPGNYDYYKNAKKVAESQEVTPVRKAENNKKQRNNAEKNHEVEKEKVFAKIESLEYEIKVIDKAKTEEKYEKLDRLNARKQEVSNDLDSEMELWFSLGES